MIGSPKDFDHSGTKRLIWKNKAEILLKDKEFAWYFVRCWIDKYNLELVPSFDPDRKLDDSESFGYDDLPAIQSDQPQEPEYLPFID